MPGLGQEGTITILPISAHIITSRIHFYPKPAPLPLRLPPPPPPPCTPPLPPHCSAVGQPTANPNEPQIREHRRTGPLISISFAYRYHSPVQHLPRLHSCPLYLIHKNSPLKCSALSHSVSVLLTHSVHRQASAGPWSVILKQPPCSRQ